MPTSWATDHNLFPREHFVTNFELVGAIDANQFHWRSHLEPIILLHIIIEKVKCTQKKQSSLPSFQPRISNIEILVRYGSPETPCSAHFFVMCNPLGLAINMLSLTMSVLFKTAIQCGYMSCDAVLDILDIVQTCPKCPNGVISEKPRKLWRSWFRKFGTHFASRKEWNPS